MGNNILLEAFAKGKTKVKLNGCNCVIYTRVSTKEQADNNLSLDTQKKACEFYASKIGYSILGYFGGTYESAKNDERKEFTNMLSFVKKSKEKVSHIIVYSVDRFSRSGANAIYLADQLKKAGISVFAVSQPTDTTTASGSLQQNIQFIFSEYDNQLRREKCMAGVKEMLLRGEWCTSPPIGYDVVKTNGRRQIVVNAKGKILKKAFYWKAQEKVTNEEVIKRLGAQGIVMSNQRMSAFFKNPFYCGLLVHTALDGAIVDGNHEKLVSKEIFLDVNEITSCKKQGYRINAENDEVPLKRFLKCDSCGKYLRAYKAKKNQKNYYKCNTIGCNCNKRADELHEAFESLLSQYSFDLNEDLMYLMKLQMIATFNQMQDESTGNIAQVESALSEINKKLERLEERYVEEQIGKGIFDKYVEKYSVEKKEIESQLQKAGKKVSNLDFHIDAAIDLSSKLATVWCSSHYVEKQKLQFLVFPDGVYYNRGKDECRTPKINSVFQYLSSLARVIAENERGNEQNFAAVPSLVARTGIEPMTFGL